MLEYHAVGIAQVRVIDADGARVVRIGELNHGSHVRGDLARIEQAQLLRETDRAGLRFAGATGTVRQR